MAAVRVADSIAELVGRTPLVRLRQVSLAAGVEILAKLEQVNPAGSVKDRVARALIVLARAIPDLVLAIIFLRMFGLGPTAGILAMGVHSVGMVAKLYGDAIEELDDGPRQSIESAGTTRRQQIMAAIPQVLMPQMIATALHRFDINLRTSVLLGYVGVGGIYATSSKDNPDPPIGIDGLRAIVQALRARKHDLPICGIAGIDASNAAPVIESGADGVAVISALSMQRDPEAAARELRGIIDAARKGH